MQISVLPLGDLVANCYVVADEAAKLCAVIDPGDEGERVAQALSNLGLKVQYILLTHGHFDHVGGVKALQSATGAPVYMHKKDQSLPPQLAGDQPSDFLDLSVESPKPVGAITFEVLETPGHSTGSVCFVARQEGADDVLFTGDTLFQGSIGRTDFPGGSIGEMMESLKKLSELPGDYRVYPGHGMETTLDQERHYNAYLREAARR